MEHDVLDHWLKGSHCEITPIEIGLLNKTFLVNERNNRFILQRMNPEFSVQINEDIDALTRHLEKRQISTTRLVPTTTGAFWVEFEGHKWRLFTYKKGQNFDFVTTLNIANQAGRIVGRFHNALTDFDHEYLFKRPNPHETKVHILKLAKAIETYEGHAYIERVKKIAQEIMKKSARLADFSKLALRHSHGDLKISNLLFADSISQSSLIDLDTIGRQAWPLEMGDAFRSWCNPKGEDSLEGYFDESLFEASLGGYAQATKNLWSKDEVSMLIEGVQIIPLELSSRFLRDALEDYYFGYNSKKFESRSAHNLVRAQSQLGVYCDIEKKKAKLERIIKRAFAQG